MQRALLTWSDAGTEGPVPAHQAPRPAGDRGPVLRLLDQDESRYDALWILTIPAGEARAETLAHAARSKVPSVEVRVLGIDDPSDYGKLFGVVGPVAAAAKRVFGGARAAWAIDVLLSAGTPQSQTIWVVLVQAGLLPARMLQVIPAVFVGKTHPRAVREARLDIEGFPEIRALRAEVARFRAEARAQALVGESEPMRALRARVARVAATDVPVLVLGETGTGKELVARAIHEASARAPRPFVAENCGVFAEGVVASELFGHEAGAFTGAAGRRRGVFEQAHQGTLLLDEVGELAPRVQSHLLRVLQEGALRRVGGEARVAVDVRVVAATHRDLAAMVAAGTFREDLYYRLRGATLEVPPLRERAGDVEVLARAFLDEVRARRGGRGLEVSREALRALSSYPWPGNVRELRAEVMRWGVFCDERVDVGDLAPEIRAPGAASRTAMFLGRARAKEATKGEEEALVVTLAAAVEAAERAAIATALGAEGGNLSRTARALGIDRNTLKRKLAAYGIQARADAAEGG